MKEKIYIAGSLFKEGDLRQREEEEILIRELDRQQEFDIFNPYKATINDNSTLPTPKLIYDTDLSHLLVSTKMLCALDDLDHGVSNEIGVVNGFNILYKLIQKVLKKASDANLRKEIEALFRKYPKKTIYAHLSDTRFPFAHNYKNYEIPISYNQFVIGAVQCDGKIFASYKDAIKQMIKN